MALEKQWTIFDCGKYSYLKDLPPVYSSALMAIAFLFLNIGRGKYTDKDNFTATCKPELVNKVV